MKIYIFLGYGSGYLIYKESAHRISYLLLNSRYWVYEWVRIHTYTPSRNLSTGFIRDGRHPESRNPQPATCRGKAASWPGLVERARGPCKRITLSPSIPAGTWAQIFTQAPGGPCWMGIQEPTLYLWPRLRPGPVGQPSWLLCGLTTFFGSEKRCRKMNSRSQAKEMGSSWSLCLFLSFTWAILWFLLSPAEVLAHKPGKQMLQRLPQRFHRLLTT